MITPKMLVYHVHHGLRKFALPAVLRVVVRDGLEARRHLLQIIKLGGEKKMSMYDPFRGASMYDPFRGATMYDPFRGATSASMYDPFRGATSALRIAADEVYHKFGSRDFLNVAKTSSAQTGEESPD